MHVCQMMYKIFEEEKINLISTLPCESLGDLLGNIPEKFLHIPLTREENGVGISAGFYLTGGKPLMIIQSSGLGILLNALMSLHKGYDLPLPIITSWRGKDEHFKGTQVHFGIVLPELFKLLKIPCTIIESVDQIEKIGQAIRDSFAHNTPSIVLVPPDIWETNEDKVTMSFGARKRSTRLTFSREIPNPQLTLTEAVRIINEFLYDSIAVTTIGDISPALYHVEDRDLNFYVKAALGQASSIGLGMAVNTKKRVYVLDGDGSLLLNPNILCETAMVNPSNMTIILLDNGTYGTTGNQKTPAHDFLDLELVARSFGFTNTRKASTQEEIVSGLESLRDGLNLLHILIKPVKSQGLSTPLEPRVIKERFMKAVLEGKS